MEAPGTKKPEKNSTQIWNRTLDEAMNDLSDIIILEDTSGDISRLADDVIKELDELIEDTLRRNEMNMPFYKRWYLWYRHWKLQRKYRNVIKS